MAVRGGVRFLQRQVDLGRQPAAGAPLPIVASRMGCRWDALCCAYDAVSLEVAAGAVFRQLVLVRVIEPTSEIHALQVLGEVGESLRSRIGP